MPKVNNKALVERSQSKKPGGLLTFAHAFDDKINGLKDPKIDTVPQDGSKNCDIISLPIFFVTYQSAAFLPK